MATEAIKATAITNLDANPAARTTRGKQAVQKAFASVTATTAKDNGSTYQMVRVRSDEIPYSIQAWLDGAVTTLTGDLTLYYSDLAMDGTDVNAGTGAVAAHVFQTAKAMAAVTSPTELFLGGNITGSSLGKPFWKLAGLSSDPGGFMDIVFLTTTTNSGTGVLNMVVEVGRD